jgi:hypothetical protein
MISINLPKNLTFGMKLLYGLLAVSIVIAIVCAIIFGRSTYLAKTMKLVRAEGTVKIEQEGGKLKPIRKNARFESGEALITGAGSLASVSLDDTKIVTLQADSRAEFTKMNKQLALKLTKGALFFEVTQKLNDDESFEIRTSTITAGIKGTSGYFYVDEEGRDTMTITDGKVLISAVNPETGERKYAEISGGQRVVVHLYSESDDDHDTIELDIQDLAEEDLEDFVLKMLGDNERLLTRVCEYTGWDRMKLRELINALLVANLSSGETVPSSEDTTEPETSSENTETQEAGEDTPTPTPKAKDTDKPEATATPKPKATTAPKGKATATPKPKAKATSTPKPTSNTQGTSGSENDPTQGGGGEPTQGGGGEPTQGGGGEPTQGGGGEPTQGGGGEPTQGGGGEPTQGGGGGSGNEPTQGGGGSNDDNNNTDP